jgi:PKD repeat protein
VKHSFSASEAAGNTNSFSDVIWDFGDGTKADGLFARHAYTKPGSYVLQVFARFGPDAESNLAISEREIIVNAPPEVDFSAPGIAYPEAELTFDASASMDPDGSITSYEWTFSDGEKAEGVSTKRRFEREGVFSVTLKVTDDSGVSNQSASITKTIKVQEKPSLAWTGQSTFCPNETFDIVKALELETEDSSNVSITVGTQKISWKQARDQKFGFPGNYQVAIEVRNPALKEGGIIRSNQTVTINGAPEVYAEVPREIIIGPANSFAVFDAQNSFDPNGDRINVYWDLGDGTQKVGKVVRHQYENAGTYTVTLTIRDTMNSECSESKKTYKVKVRKE